MGVFGKNRIQNGIRDLVSDLVRMTFGNGFGGKEIVRRSCSHDHVLILAKPEVRLRRCVAPRTDT
jgi:hypothetical protein